MHVARWRCVWRSLAPCTGQQIVHASIKGYLSCLQTIVAGGSRWTNRTFVTTPPLVRHTSRLPCSAGPFRRLAIQPLFFPTAGGCPTRLNLHVLLEARSARRSPASLHGGCTCTASSDPDSSPRHPFPPRPFRKRQLDLFDHVTRRRTPHAPFLSVPSVVDGRAQSLVPAEPQSIAMPPFGSNSFQNPRGSKGGHTSSWNLPLRLEGVPRSSFVSKISSPSTVLGSVGWTTIGRTMPGDHVRDRRFPPTQDRSILAVRKSFLFIATVDLHPEVPAHRSFAPVELLGPRSTVRSGPGSLRRVDRTHRIVPRGPRTNHVLDPRNDLLGETNGRPRFPPQNVKRTSPKRTEARDHAREGGPARRGPHVRLVGGPRSEGRAHPSAEGTEDDVVGTTHRSRGRLVQTAGGKNRGVCHLARLRACQRLQRRRTLLQRGRQKHEEFPARRRSPPKVHGRLLSARPVGGACGLWDL